MHTHTRTHIKVIQLAERHTVAAPTVLSLAFVRRSCVRADGVLTRRHNAAPTQAAMAASLGPIGTPCQALRQGVCTLALVMLCCVPAGPCFLFVFCFLFLLCKFFCDNQKPA